MEKQYNVVIIGNEYVGKSNILLRITNNNFIQDHFPNHGTIIKVTDWYLNGKTYKLKIRDTPSLEKYLQFQIDQIKEADIIFLVYDVTD